jgi:hypothetical protein
VDRVDKNMKKDNIETSLFEEMFSRDCEEYRRGRKGLLRK